LIGGGRWGQVTLSVLGKIPVPFAGIAVVSKHNAHEIQRVIAEIPSSVPISLTESIENLLNTYTVKAAIIVNSAQQHFDTAMMLIERGIHVLIEKPIVLTTEQMNILLETAARKKVCVFPGLCYQFCSYLDNFSKLILQHEAPKKFIVEWHEKSNEVRYGQTKKFDANINIAQDVMPHIWTILTKIFQEKNINISKYENLNDAANFSVSLNNISGKIILKRNASSRQRTVLLQMNEKKYFKIDFSTEPGEIYSASEKISADEHWHKNLSPLAQQLLQFFSYIEVGQIKNEVTEKCLDSVKFTERASTLLDSI
jgi:predicted dehydrogenase